MAKTLRSYHFSFGDSGTGPIGFCARIRAYSKAQATEILRERLSEFHSELNMVKDSYDEPPTGIEYIEVYFGDAAINKAAIDEWEVIPKSEREAA